MARIVGVTYEYGTVKELTVDHIVDAITDPEGTVHFVRCTGATEFRRCDSCDFFASFPTPAEDFDGLCGASTGHHEVDYDEWCARYKPRKGNQK